ncbi:MAG: glycosyltransferase family 4 protein [candidate division KSB1 bacterium]|nr:glycosyltransferase family 4 protein [candidate division KSB1 bacterium]
MHNSTTLKKIVYLNYMQDLYGSALGSTIKARELLHGLQELDYKVHFFWRCEKPADTDNARPNRKSHNKNIIRTLLFTPFQILKALVSGVEEAKIVRRVKPDLLITRLDAFRFSSVLVSNYYNLPLILEADGACSYEWLQYHGGPHLWPRWLLLCEKFIMKHSDHIFVQSLPTQSYYLQTHRISKSKITVITNGAHPSEPVPEKKLDNLRQLYNIQTKETVIGFSGSMHHWHGIEQLKELITDILAHYKTCKFIFVGGGGPETASIREQFKHETRVVFTGNVPFEHMPAHLALFDIALAPYPPMPLFYFSPVKLFEYMAAGKAIVAARIGQINNVLKNKVTGMLYTPGDLDDMHSCIKTLVENPGLRSKLAQNAQHEFRQKHTWAQKSNQLAHLIETTLNKRKCNESTSTC